MKTLESTPALLSWATWITEVRDLRRKRDRQREMKDRGKKTKVEKKQEHPIYLVKVKVVCSPPGFTWTLAINQSASRTHSSCSVSRRDSSRNGLLGGRIHAYTSATGQLNAWRELANIQAAELCRKKKKKIPICQSIWQSGLHPVRYHQKMTSCQASGRHLERSLTVRLWVIGWVSCWTQTLCFCKLMEHSVIYGGIRAQ